MKLIDPLEYQTTEIMYEGNAYQIACELDVTLQIVQDYQLFLDSNLAAPARPIEPLIT